MSGGVPDDLWATPPATGGLPLRESMTVVQLLEPYESDTGDTLYFVYSASNNVTGTITAEVQPSVKIGHDRYHIFRGTIRSVENSIAGIRPTLWWPEHRAWFVASDIDLHSTFVGASDAATRSLAASTDIEYFTVAADTSILGSADTLNNPIS